MKPRVLTIIGLTALLCLSAIHLIQLDWGNRVSTDVMKLIPMEEEGSGSQAGRVILSDLYSDRVIAAIFSLQESASLRAYMTTLEASPLVERVAVMNDPGEMHALLGRVFELRFELLLPDWLVRNEWSVGEDEEKLAAGAAEALDAALDDPATLAYEETITRDPLLLAQQATQSALEAMPGSGLSEGTYLLEISLTVSTLSPPGQEPVIALLDQARQAAREIEPTIEVLDTGAHRYAYETEQRMREELKWLNIASVLAVFLICAVLCRRLWLILHIGVVVLLSVSSGLVLMSSFVEQMHVFALIFGSVLCGVIVDYTLHAYWHTSRTEGRKGSFKKPFLISCGSTLLGFALLLFSELPVVRQMGLMIVSCLLMAVWITPAYVFVVLRAVDKKRVTIDLKCPEVRPVWIGLAGLFLLPFLITIEWKDDIRELEYPLPHLDATDARIRSLNGAEQQVWITLGSSYADSRDQLESFHQWLDAEGVPPQQYFSAANWVPPYRRYLLGQQFIQGHPGFGDLLIESLDRIGYEREAFQPFRKDWLGAVDHVSTTQASYDALVGQLSGYLSGGCSSLFGSRGESYWWLTIIEGSEALPVPPVGLGTVALNQTEHYTEALGQFRERLLKLSLIGLFAVSLIVCLSFGFSRGLAILWVPAISVSVSSLITMYFAGSLNMFHLIGLFLGACLSLDYAVFTMTQAPRSRSLPFSVLVSAMTTSASFAVLACSRIPAIHALGMSVVAVTLAGLFMSYFWVLPLALKKEVNHAE